MRLITAAALAAALACLPAARATTLTVRVSPKDAAEATANCQSVNSSAGRKDGYLYCGKHWQMSKLPIRFRINMTGVPATLAPLGAGLQSQFELAAEAAAAAWDTGTPVTGTGARLGGCAAAKIVCIERTDNMTVLNPSDGINIIKFDHLGGYPGTAYVNPSTGNRITDSDIVLNSDAGSKWYWSGTPLVTGTAAGAVCFFDVVCEERYDVQSILTHEIGHALGLLHPGYYVENDPAHKGWPSDLNDAPNYNLVMYPIYRPNNATQRALGWGDVLGLQAVMVDSQSDP